MPEMTVEVQALWARTGIRRWLGRLVLVSLPHASLPEAARLIEGGSESGRARSFAALVVEDDEVSLTIDESTWSEAAGRIAHNAVAGPYAAITLLLDIDLGVCGYLLPAARLLAEAGISIVPQCAYLKDHLLIRDEDADRAVLILEGLVAEAVEAPNRA
jgi:hypothetical protein